MHESVIYGYDTEKQLFLVSYIHNGRFGKNKISYERLVHAFADALNIIRKIHVNFFAGVTGSILLRVCIFVLIIMRTMPYITFEEACKRGKRCKSKNIRYDQNLEKAKDALPYSGLAYEDEYYYSGLACLIGIEEIISNILSKTSEPEEWVTQRLSHSLFTLYEHCNIIKNRWNG